ncbi:pyridoxal phosphate-dependent transferase [Kockovaella imperatae]|uniref:Pyridoxal phosphate-dependent transferase n=1 Tax=Kockovaella imperatae TaxID=4999 RepID=A0A1Y1UEH4_9TREE|nr:pyridoxal phosphate-dependent transferase [Kockovaella imperatae]ORX36389.1 pyridoxal phosphate-dependent transferase [Kockovaella imperatae]
MSSALRFGIAPAVTATTAPPIPKAREWATSYLASNPELPLLDLSQGVPGDPPDETVLAALAKASSDPRSAKYGSILGEIELREALAEEFNVQYGVGSSSSSSGRKSSKLSAQDIGITTGCNMAFLVLVMALCPPSTSSVLLPLPAYFNHSMVMTMQSVKPLYIPCEPESGFRPSISAARDHLETAKGQSEGSTRPRMICLVTPNNPTGAVYSPRELEDWYDLAKEFEVALVLDETYRDFVDGPPHHLFDREDWRETLVSLGSFSKGYRIPGHRLGSIVASPDLLRHLATVCDCMQICAPRPPQIALASLLPSLRVSLTASSVALQSRHRLFTEIITSIPGWQVVSQGGFYAYVAFPEDYKTASSALGRKRKSLGSEDVAKVLSLQCGVLTLPGSFFCPSGEELEALEGAGTEQLREDKWLRFAIANVDDEAVRQLGPRLHKMNGIMGFGEEVVVVDD